MTHKLTPEDKLKIQQSHHLSLTALSEIYGISKQYASLIRLQAKGEHIPTPRRRKTRAEDMMKAKPTLPKVHYTTNWDDP